MPYGATIQALHVSRTDVDSEEDVPTIEVPARNVQLVSRTRGHSGRKLYSVEGELWRREWVEPALSSPIVRRDKTPPTVYFVTDASGAQETRETLAGGGRWLWFQPAVRPGSCRQAGWLAELAHEGHGRRSVLAWV